MRRFFKVQMNDKFLTSTGNAMSKPCKVEVTNVPLLQTSLVGPARRVASGNAKEQLSKWIEGKEFEIKIFSMKSDVYNQFRLWAEEVKQALFYNPLDPSVNFIVKGTEAAVGGFEVSATWQTNNPISYGRFKYEYVFDIVFRLRTRGVIT